jgi:hypothetical protein
MVSMALRTDFPPLFAGLIDDAGLYEPESLPMADALDRHLSGPAAGHRMLTGRFLCPASRLQELAEVLDGVRLSLALICPWEPEALRAALALVAAHRGLLLAAVEGPEGDPALLAEVPARTACFMEVPVEEIYAVKRPADGSYGLKVRCGGTSADAFPAPDRLAGFVLACAIAGVRFKATAGLHRAVAHVDPVTGYSHHGFLNLLLATYRASSDGDFDAVLDVLVETDAGALVAEARSLSAQDIAVTRQLFVSFGSCSTTEPIEDLHALGLIDEGVPA